MKIGSQSGVQFRGKEMFDVDTGFGATHILTRIIDDPKRTPVGGEELLEQIVLDAQKIATDFNTIYVGNGGNLILHNSNTQDSLIVKPQKDEVSIVSMFKQSGVKKFGNPIWTGKNTQPQREAFIGKISGMDVIAQGNRVISKPAEVKKKVVTPLNIANLANEAIPAPKPGKLTLKKPAQKLSLRSTDTPEFKKWFGDSKIVNKDGTPKVMYHGTARDITEFRPKQANAIFVTDDPRFAEAFSFTSQAYMVTEYQKSLDPKKREELKKKAERIAKKEGTDVQDELDKIIGREISSGPNIIPLYIKAESPFDYQSEEDVQGVIDYIEENKTQEEIYDAFNRDLDILDDLRSEIESGKWMTIENPIVQEAIKFNRHDGFYVREGGKKNLAVYKPNQIKSAVGNIGTFSPETGDIRYSIRDNLGTDVADAIDRTTTKRQEEGFAQKVAQALSPLGFARFRQQFVNRYEGIERQSSEIGKQFGDAELLADQSAIAAALMSDRASGVAAEAFRNGVPVYDRGFTYVDNLNGQVKGLIPIFEPLMRFNDPYIFQAFQYYAGTKRGKRLLAEGREQVFTAEEIRRGKLLGKQYPVFEQVFNDFQDFNKQVVKYMVDTGVISAEMGVKWTENSDYIPFYRQMEGERTAGPNIFSSFANIVKPKKLKGGEAPLDDFLETVIRNTRSAIEAGMKNVAQQRVIRDAVRLGTASPLPAGARMGPDVTTVRVDGKDKHFIVDDPLLIESLKGLNLPRLPFLDVLAAPSRFLREMVTRDPGFIIANLFRDSVSSWVTTGTNIRPVADTFKQYGKVLAGLSPEATALARAGIGTGYEFAGDVKASTEAFTKELQKKAGQKTLAQKALMPVSAMWDALEKGSTASDVATRAEVYKRVLEETGNEAEAIYQAMEVINFSRMGSSPIIQIASALIPFFNARVQGLDVLYRAGFGRAASARKDRQQKAFLTRSLAILALSSLYWWLASDQEEWERAEPEQRDNNWIIGPVKLPIPFEIGVVFKVFPERILEYFFGNDTSKDLKDSFVRNLTSTMAVNPIPQAVLPIIENVANYSFFTGQPIVGKGLDDVADPYQISSSTSLFAKKLGETTGFSPVKLDNLIRGYTGTLGTYGTMLIDEIIRTESDPTKPSLSIERVPVLKRFIATKEGTGTVSAFYDMKNRVDEAVRTVNALERTGDYKNLIEYQKENGKLLAMKDYIRSMERDMKDLRDSRRQVLVSRMDPDLKNDALENIRKAEIALTSRMQYIKKVVD